MSLLPFDEANYLLMWVEIRHQIMDTFGYGIPKAEEWMTVYLNAPYGLIQKVDPTVEARLRVLYNSPHAPTLLKAIEIRHKETT